MKGYLLHIGLLLIALAIVLMLAMAHGYQQPVPSNPFTDYQAFMPGESALVAQAAPGCKLDVLVAYERARYITCRNVGAFRWIFVSAPDEVIRYTSFYPGVSIKAGWLWRWFDGCQQVRSKWMRRVRCAAGVEAVVSTRRRFRWNPSINFSDVLFIRFREVES